MVAECSFAYPVGVEYGAFLLGTACGCGRGHLHGVGLAGYIETFSAYARNMLGSLERPDVDLITGLSPVIAIEQKTINRNPRSTIGTTTEIYDFLRLLYARAGHARSYLSGKDMVRYTRERIVDLILKRYAGQKIYILAPVVRNRKGHYKELFEQLRKKGFINVRVDGELMEITPGLRLDRYKNHSVEIVVDRLAVSDKEAQRLDGSVESALRHGDKQLMIYSTDDDSVAHYSQSLMDPETGLSYHEPAPHNFSFNSPQGACPYCSGLGYVDVVDSDKVIPDPSLSIHDGAIAGRHGTPDTLPARRIGRSSGWRLFRHRRSAAFRCI